MKMTRPEWNYLKRIALDHPYYDTHKLPLTEQEASAIVKANISMTGKEFVDSVYAKLGKTRPAKGKKRLAWLRDFAELLSVPTIRRVAIAVLAVVLITVFFTATPAGRAIAENVIQYISSLLDDGRLFVNRNDNETVMNPANLMPLSDNFEAQEQENSEVFVNTFEDFITIMDKHPTVLPFPYIELYYYYDEFVDYLSLRAKYVTPKGTIDTSQIWNSEDMISSTGNGFTIYDADPSIYYSFDNDGTLNILKIYEDSVFVIIANDSYTVEEILSLLMVE